MNEQNLRIEEILRIMIQMACKNLSKDDIAQLRLFVLNRVDPRLQPWYDTVASLFTARDGARMHDETVRLFLDIYQ